MAEKDDHELVVGLQANDPVFQKLLADKYGGRLLSIVISLGLSREDGVEVVNDTIYKIIKNIRVFDLKRGTKFTAWITQIAINTARDKHKQLKDPLISESIDEREGRGIQDTESLWQQQSHSSELGQLSQKILNQALESISETDQNIIRWCACGFKHKEIAVFINKTIGAVKVPT